ncbi:MAG: hypothetical protein N2557_05180 [Hydrogenophilus sp.]|nr:hypothetical protein [Hydrogenophilus sp.]
MLLYLFLGITHQPWRGEDLRHLLPAWEIARGQQWPAALSDPALIPFGPLYAWLAAPLGRAAEMVGFPFHAGSRLATPIFLLVAVTLTALSGQRLGLPSLAPVAALAAAAPLGWLIFAHLHSAVAAAAAALALLTLLPLSPPHHPLSRLALLLLATAIAYWALGAVGLLLSLGAHLLSALPSLSPSSPPRPIPSWVLLGGALLTLLLSAALTLRIPAVWAWFKLTLPETLPSHDQIVDALLRHGSWNLWPLWLVAFWPIRLYDLWRNPLLRRLSLWLLWATATLLATTPISDSTLLLLTPPLALLAALRLLRVGEGTLAAFAWFSLVLTGVLLLLIAATAAAQTLGWPPGLARHIARQLPGYSLPAVPWRLLFAGTALLLWLWAVRYLPRDPLRTAFHWLTSMAFLWLLALAFLYPWYEATRTLQPVVTALTAHPIAQNARCLSFDLSLSLDQKAAFRYHTAWEERADCPIAVRRVVGSAPHGKETVLLSVERGLGRARERWQLLTRSTLLEVSP